MKCAHHLVRPRQLSSILSVDRNSNQTPEGAKYILPFQNIKSRTTVRVVDFFPSNLADFAVPCSKVSEFDCLSDRDDSQNESGNDSRSSCGGIATSGEKRWEWRFRLTLEDGQGQKQEDKAAVDVYVAGQDAECLLKLDAEE